MNKEAQMAETAFRVGQPVITELFVQMAKEQLQKHFNGVSVPPETFGKEVHQQATLMWWGFYKQQIVQAEITAKEMTDKQSKVVRL